MTNCHAGCTGERRRGGKICHLLDDKQNSVETGKTGRFQCKKQKR
jgi:hypothetical protein